jgi:hypothetical protein
MIRASRLLIAALLSLPLPAGAQSTAEWKAIGCAVEAPDMMRGTVLTFYFTESGQIRLEQDGRPSPATVTSAEIRYC